MDNKDSSDPAGLTVKVNIFDQLYSLRSPKGEEHVRQIAEVVDERMRQIAAHTTTFELSRIAVLAALNIADELQDLKARAQAKTDAPLSSVSTEAGEEAEPNDSAKTEETGRSQTWFEAIFDAEVPVKERSERLSSQVSTKLQTIRQDSKETDAADK
ncbi:MAG: cell division protein ZapA [Pyrinomonadaceae bacterium]|nr:cell division protein ZapA [Pyrinomonadaceae bacterium]